MYDKYSYSGLLLLYLVLSQTLAGNLRIICTFYKGLMPPKIIDIPNMEKKNELRHVCLGAFKITLEGESTLTMEGVNDAQGFLIWLFWATELEMCVSVENAKNLHKLMVETASIVGECEGPKLSIVNNINLKSISIRNKKFGENLSSEPTAIRIRGNQKLTARDLEKLKKVREKMNGNLDLQPLGECALPKPFTSFEMLDQNCTHFYGPLILQKGITHIQYDLLKVHKFNLEGCIQIQHTDLKDISFLNAFTRFRRMHYCNQFIRNNKKLCSKNLNYLNEFFKDILFSNNTDLPCDECIGGQVSERYLRESINCSIVYGDLVIADFRGMPRNIENLRGIKAIEGRLILINNTGLNRFSYLSSLEKVGRKDGNDVAIILKDNGDLNLLELSDFLNTQLKKEVEQIELVNNPMLNQDLTKAAQLYTSFAKGHAGVIKLEYTTSAQEDSGELGSVITQGPLPTIGKTGYNTIFQRIAVAAIIVFLCCFAIFLVHRQKTFAKRLPQEPHKLNASSKGKTSSSRMSTSQSVLQSKSVSLSAAASSNTLSSSSHVEQARRPAQCSQH